MNLTRLSFFGLLAGTMTRLFGQTPITIEACAPVYGPRMPKPCPGQCPACGLAHGRITDKLPAGAFVVLVGEHMARVVRSCDWCANAFFQEAPDSLVWGDMRQGQ